jgi:hypothetical protein
MNVAAGARSLSQVSAPAGRRRGSVTGLPNRNCENCRDCCGTLSKFSMIGSSCRYAGVMIESAISGCRQNTFQYVVCVAVTLSSSAFPAPPWPFAKYSASGS